jgi:hypothetical protein
VGTTGNASCTSDGRLALLKSFPLAVGNADRFFAPMYWRCRECSCNDLQLCGVSLTLVAHIITNISGTHGRLLWKTFDLEPCMISLPTPCSHQLPSVIGHDQLQIQLFNVF